MGFDGHHGLSTAKPCTTGMDDLDVLDSFLFHLPEDQGMKFFGSCSNSAGPHVEVDLGPISSLLKREIRKSSFP